MSSSSGSGRKPAKRGRHNSPEVQGIADKDIPSTTPDKGTGGGGSLKDKKSKGHRLLGSSKTNSQSPISPNVKKFIEQERQQHQQRLVKVLRMKKESWVDRNLPKSLEEHFVHKKKVEEVQTWMKRTMDKSLSKAIGYKPSKICVAMGPPGAGKTASVFLMAKELGIEIKEWINPMTLMEYRTDKKYDPDEVQGRSQFDLFQDFLFRASQYGTLPIKNRQISDRKLVIVEDFPNTFYRNVELFHNRILRPYAANGVFPVVFIIPDSASRETNACNLFPKSIVDELNICCISFNAVAPTYMVKFLTEVCLREGVRASKELLQAVAETSGGDVRCAINTLEFKLARGESPKVMKPPDNRNKPRRGTFVAGSAKKNQLEEFAKDETLFIFRALGKVLYAKRTILDEVDTSFNVPKKAVQYLRKNPLEEVPEQMLEKIDVPADSFLGFLHQNYLPFFGSMHDSVTASALLADSEFMLARWPFDDSGTASRSFRERETREELALLVASRGLMYANVHKTRNEWRPLRKPVLTDVRTRINQSLEHSRMIFVMENPLSTSFFSEDLPFYYKLLQRRRGKGSWLNEHYQFIKDLGRIETTSTRRVDDKLSEKDAVEDFEVGERGLNSSEPEDSETASTGPSGQTAHTTNPDEVLNVQINGKEDEEEFVIGDYSDED